MVPGTHFMIVVKANLIEIYVNDRLVIYYVDESSPVFTGKIGIGAMLHDSPSSSVYFDNVRVTSISND